MVCASLSTSALTHRLEVKRSYVCVLHGNVAIAKCFRADMLPINFDILLLARNENVSHGPM